MGGKQIRPARVYKSVVQQLQNHVLPNQRMAAPSWLSAMQAIPPSETLIRTPAVSHTGAAPPSSSGKHRKPRNLYRPQRIVHPEDALRTIFFRDHPWELARPRILVESDGKDYQRVDWSTGLRQPGVQLTGECVVQRQLYLMENEGMGRDKAYDKVRREFYRLRQEEEIEKRLALEEAKHVGAYFGKSRIDVGLMLEDHEYENWKVWAGKETKRREMNNNTVEEEEAEPEAPEAAAPAVAAR